MPEYYVYDANGRLMSEAVLVQMSINGQSQVLMFPIHQYIWGPDRVLAQIDAASGIYYYLYNGHGDVVQIVDTAGNIKNSYDYDIWGNFLKKEETIDNPFTYFGQTYDEVTGLYYLRARYYDPTTGRFTQQDPAEDGYNWYVYGNQNPLKYVDPSGLYYLEKDANGQVYAIIEVGDTLSAIAKAEVNVASAYSKMTGVSNYNNIYVGQKVNITGIYNSAYPKPIIVASTNGNSTANNRRPSTGEPGSTYTNPKGDSRVYGPDGKPELDVDQPHGHNPEPHIHRWPDGVRGPAEPIPSEFSWGGLIIGGIVTIVELAGYFYGMPVDLPGN